MKWLPSSRYFYLLTLLFLLLAAACSLPWVWTPTTPDPSLTPTPTLAPISTTVFDLIPTLVAPPYLEAEPVEVDPFADIKDCDADWVAKEVLAEPDPEDEATHQVKIDCHLTLDSRDTVTKRLIFETSGVTLECNGASITGGDSDGPQNVNFKKDMIEVRSPSRLAGRERIWERPRSITIRGCVITGSIRVWGMSTNGEGVPNFSEGDQNPLKTSSRLEGHAERVRANAPTAIVFDGITVIGVGRNPVYFAPGVTFSKLINSEITGRSDAVAIYLDAETYANTIKNNLIHPSTARELIAIDASSHNRIINNRFSSLNHGGIYLYRNCGQGGVTRHTTPSYNQIINNIFYYRLYQGPNPSVYLGSRDGDRPYCGRDSDSDFGSGVSNKDHATHNVIMQNQIFVRSIGAMIRTQNPTVNSPNYIDYNHTVTDETVIYNGLAGCYIADGYRDFVPHATVVDVFRGANNLPICTNYKDTCSDGALIRSSNPACALTTEAFECSVTGSNDGCSKTVTCPSGKRIVAAVGACNLEWGTIPDAALSSVAGNTIQVFRASDTVSSGSCNIGMYSLQAGEMEIEAITGSFAVSVGCREYDVNGGDCQIRGRLYCR